MFSTVQNSARTPCLTVLQTLIMNNVLVVNQINKNCLQQGLWHEWLPGLGDANVIHCWFHVSFLYRLQNNDSPSMKTLHKILFLSAKQWEIQTSTRLSLFLVIRQNFWHHLCWNLSHSLIFRLNLPHNFYVHC